MLVDIKSLNDEELENFITDSGFPKFRAKQIRSWLSKNVTNFDEMRNIPTDLREFLKTSSYISVANIEKKLVSRYDKTVKYLFSFNDGECVESVVMSYKHGWSMCISTQVGCKMGCTFCATGKSGFSRSLTPSEMLAQIEAAQRDLDIRISNVVLMGMGEPLDNYDNVLKFLHLVSSEDGLNISQRNITLSTCGIVPKIYQLADDGVSVTLTISLHATSDEKRREFMPIANAYSIQEILKACRYYFEKTGRRIGFEYSLIAGGNDSLDEADKLSALLKGLPCHVNVIPLNSVKERALVGTNIKKAYAFVERLNENGISATKRRTMGEDIGGACGQLRSKVLRGEEC